MEEADDRGAHTILIRDVRAIPTTREKKVSSKATQASASLEEGVSHHGVAYVLR